MRRVAFSVCALAVTTTAFSALLSLAGPEVAFYALIAGLLVLAIVAIVLLSSVFTLAYLLLFESLGGRFIGDRFSIFVGWTLLRSQKLVPSWRLRLRRQWWDLRRAGRGQATLRIGSAALLLCTAWALQGHGIFNALAEALSPTFVRILQVSSVASALALALWGAPSLGAPPAAADRPGGVHKSRAWVTLPTFISIVGVSIGVWALIVVLSVMHGFEADLRDKILRTNAHVTIEPRDPSGALTDPFDLRDAVGALPGVTESHVEVHGEVMMASRTNVAVNVLVKGMAPSDLASSSQIRGRVNPGSIRWLAQPEFLLSDRRRFPISAPTLDSSDPLSPTGVGSTSPDQRVLPGILLGVELADSLNVDVGSEIQVIAPDGDVGPTGLRPKLKAFRVAGLFRTGMYEYDQKLAYMTLSAAQHFFNMGASMNRMEIRLTHTDATPPVMGAIDDLLSRRFPTLEATDWKVRNKSLFSALQLERVVMFIVLGFIILVSSLLIVSSLVMIVVEKARDIAVLKALGASSAAITRTFLVIGGIIGAVGSVSGLTLGIGSCQALMWVGIPLPREYYIDRLPVEMVTGEVLFVAAAAFTICLLATIYPCREASQMHPVDGLRHG